jgi:hypothetical protein
MKHKAELAAVIAGAAERVREAIQDRLEEVASMQLDADLQASELVRKMGERTGRLQASFDNHARQCVELEAHINEAIKLRSARRRPDEPTDGTEAATEGVG